MTGSDESRVLLRALGATDVASGGSDSDAAATADSPNEGIGPQGERSIHAFETTGADEYGRDQRDAHGTAGAVRVV